MHFLTCVYQMKLSKRYDTVYAMLYNVWNLYLSQVKTLLEIKRTQVIYTAAKNLLI